MIVPYAISQFINEFFPKNVIQCNIFSEIKLGKNTVKYFKYFFLVGFPDKILLHFGPLR